MKTIVWLAISATVAGVLVLLRLGGDDRALGAKKMDESFAQPTDVQGISCSYVVYRDDGSLKSCVLGRPDTLSGQILPEGTIVFFSAKGEMETCLLQEDLVIQGHLCKGHSDDWQTAFYPSGKLKIAWLAREETIQGVPCAASYGRSFFSRGAATCFHEDGSLASCQLSGDLTIGGRLYTKGDRVNFDPDRISEAKR